MDSETMIEEGYTPLGKECGVCELGEYWSNSYEVVCINCSNTLRKNDFTESDIWTIEDFYTDRPRDKEGNIIPQGRFPSAYTDWNPQE